MSSKFSKRRSYTVLLLTTSSIIFIYILLKQYYFYTKGKEYYASVYSDVIKTERKSTLTRHGEKITIIDYRKCYLEADNYLFTHITTASNCFSGYKKTVLIISQDSFIFGTKKDGYFGLLVSNNSYYYLILFIIVIFFCLFFISKENIDASKRKLTHLKIKYIIQSFFTKKITDQTKLKEELYDTYSETAYRYKPSFTKKEKESCENITLGHRKKPNGIPSNILLIQPESITEDEHVTITTNKSNSIEIDARKIKIPYIKHFSLISIVNSGLNKVLFTFSAIFFLLIIPAWGTGKIDTKIAATYTTFIAALFLGRILPAIFNGSFYEINRFTGMITIWKEMRESQKMIIPFGEMKCVIRPHAIKKDSFEIILLSKKTGADQLDLAPLNGKNPTKLAEAERLWEFVQQFMDVSQPLPDLPILEAFRHLDPTTAAHDRQTERPHAAGATSAKKSSRPQQKPSMPNNSNDSLRHHNHTKTGWRKNHKASITLAWWFLYIQLPLYYYGSNAVPDYR
ncbi:hypothetical protein QCD60_10355 [Pokkaliibacter sp. MBI-7]|uniref:hypothetical protein n=1 Tax=Pokkaliibacter sp. MBI-7 TaxID=3040600 RepID=UPI00244CE375|nr:hypothetical protein [Pokkaliibacter sp. MBI-7]MDH2432968.1 hypothetical protein [Pokkaliibacter sp. MBI-7]